MRDWENIYKTEGIVQKEPEGIVRDAIPILKQNGVKRVLDLGCGTGRHSLLLAKEGFEVYCIDKSPKALEILKGRAKDAGVEFELREGDMGTLPYEDKSFDAVVSTHVIQHGTIADITRVAAEVDRVLKPGGVLVIKSVSSKTELPPDMEMLEERTAKGGPMGEEDVPHHYFVPMEFKGLFDGYEVLRLEEVKESSERFGCDRWYVQLIFKKPGRM